MAGGIDSAAAPPGFSKIFGRLNLQPHGGYGCAKIRSEIPGRNNARKSAQSGQGRLAVNGSAHHLAKFARIQFDGADSWFWIA